MLKLNPNAKLVANIQKSTAKKDGHCPCLIFETEDTMCPFFANNKYPLEAEIADVCVYSQKNCNVAEEGCHCTLYVPK